MNTDDEGSIIESNTSDKRGFDVDSRNVPEALLNNRTVVAIPIKTKSEKGLGSGIPTRSRQDYGPLNVKYLKLDQLRANPRNARRHSKRQIKLLAAAIKKFGFLGVILIDATGMILAGHGRWMAAVHLGLDVVACMVVEHLDEAAKRAFIISDNRLGELSEWNYEILKLELAELEDLEIDFELSITGFDTPHLDRIIGPEKLGDSKHVDLDGFSKDPDDSVPALDAA